MPMHSKVGLNVKNISYGPWNCCAGNKHLLHSYFWKPVGFLTKIDFTVSKELAREATHRSSMLSRILSLHCSVVKWEASPEQLKSFSYLKISPVLFQRWQNVFLPLSSLLLHWHWRKEKHQVPSYEPLRWKRVLPEFVPSLSLWFCKRIFQGLEQ